MLNRAFMSKLMDELDTRQKEVDTYIGFVDQVIVKAGVRIMYQEYRYHTRTEWKLDNFFHFSFSAVFGLAETGGSTIKVLFSGPSGLKEVFEVYWCDRGNPEVRLFDDDKEWREKLGKLIAKKDMYLKRFISAKKNVEESAKFRADKKAAEEEELTALLRRAERLGVTVDRGKLSTKA